MLPILIQRKFARRQQSDLIDRINAALRVDVKGADLIDLITKQIQPIRYGTTHRKKIDQPATYRVFAGCHYLRSAGVAREGKVFTQAFEVEARFDPDKKRMPGQKLAWTQARHRRGDRYDADIELCLGKVIERRQSL